MIPRRTSTLRLLPTLTALALTGLAGSGCSNGVEGSFLGAGLGAGGGAIIGSMVGHAGTGAVIGAVSGALAGAVIGDQNERNDRRSGYDSRRYDDSGYYRSYDRRYDSATYEYSEHHYYRRTGD